MSGPIKPEDILLLKRDNIPEEVFEAFNELIAEHIRNNIATFKQDDVVVRIKAKLPNLSSAQIFDNGWLDIEPLYQAAGWIVSYDKPGYCEDYPATFSFKRPKR